MREGRAGWQFPATIGVLVLNVIVFGVQYFTDAFPSESPFNHYFALSLDGLKSGFLWQLLTYQFMHANLVHIFLNSWAIFVFGRVIERTLGARRMLLLYFLSGVVGGGLQMLGTWLLPGLMNDIPVVGASAGAFGLIAAFAALFPNQVLYMLLFYIIPIKMRAMTLLWLSVIISLIGIIYPYIDPFIPAGLGINHFFENIGHAAHLGGILTGYIFARLLIQGGRSAPPANQFY